MKTFLIIISLFFNINLVEAKKVSNPTVKITTSMGEMTAEIYLDKTPITAENFLGYVKSGFFKDVIFHRVINNFMIQGGGFDEKMNKKPTKDPIKLETGKGLSNERGTLSMARTNDPNSATSQFFINHKDNANLDSYGGGYAVFGKLKTGLDILDKIANVETTSKAGHGDVPVKPITFTVSLVEEKK